MVASRNYFKVPSQESGLRNCADADSGGNERRFGVRVP